MVDEKINVMHLLLSLETGGMERFVYEHCLSIDKKKFNVSVCCIDSLGGFYKSLLENGVKVELVKKNQKHFDYFFPLKLSKYLKKNNIKILHIHSGAFFHGSVAGFLAGTKGVIYTEHGRHLVEPKIIFILDKISSIFVDYIVTVSSELKRYLVEKIKLPEKKITTIINGVNTICFDKREKSKLLLDELGLVKENKIVGAVGRLAQIKDHATLVKAFSLVESLMPEARLVIVGEGPLEYDLKNLTKQLNLVDKVLFVGNRDNIPDFLNLFDVYVLPSLLEGTSLSLLEAMASGLPCVVTNVGGNPGIVVDGHNGYLVDKNDHQAMSEKIMALLKNSGFNEELSKNARATVVSGFSLSKNILEYQYLYIKLTNKS